METEMKVKYNRVSTIGQSGDRFSADNEKYDLVLLDKVSGTVPFMEREKGKEIVKLVEDGKVTDIVVEELSRLGRHVGDVYATLQWLDSKGINVVVRNMGNMQSRPNNEKNKYFDFVTSMLNSLYSMELENIKERTMAGRMVYVQAGGKLGRPTGSTENEKQFINKNKSREILKYLNKNRTIREISKITSTSNKTIIKVRRIGVKYGLLQPTE
jgi:DNA invertase Pin-like site-specific DNA recombinase